MSNAATRHKNSALKHAEEQLLTTAQVKTLLNISNDLIDKFRRYRDDPIPFMRVGGRYLYDKAKILAWAEAESIRDPNRELRDKFPWERRPRSVVAGTSKGSDQDKSSSS